MKLSAIAGGVVVTVAGLCGTGALAQYASDPYDSTGYPANPPQGAPAYSPAALSDSSSQNQAAPPTYNSNVQSNQDYQSALSAYDAAQNAAAQQRDVYNRDSADYRASQADYQRRLRAYYRARDAYDAEFGPGAYEAYYGPPAPWD
jgi:hypothetical protein